MTTTQVTGMSVSIPTVNGSAKTVQVREPAKLEVLTRPPMSRQAFAAGHVVANPATAAQGAPTSIDWEATLKIRRELWALGLGVAESMDTAQRGMGMDAEMAMELAERTLAEAAKVHGNVVVGIATDALVTGGDYGLQDISDAYIDQLRRVEAAGGTAVIMASRHLAAKAKSAQDYLHLYRSVIDAAKKPVILHWLGPMFDPALEGYWGSADLEETSNTVLSLIESRTSMIAGIKISLLDAAHEVKFRRRIPASVRLYTGDDFNYSELVAGDDRGYSDALLGAFSAVPRFASAALKKLDAADAAGFKELMDQTIPLSRLVFEAPTQYYKVGIVWLAYLNGQQDHFRMIGGLETGRSLEHLGRIYEEANSIGLFANPELTAERAAAYFKMQGL